MHRLRIWNIQSIERRNNHSNKGKNIERQKKVDIQPHSRRFACPQTKKRIYADKLFKYVNVQVKFDGNLHESMYCSHSVCSPERERERKRAIQLTFYILDQQTTISLSRGSSWTHTHTHTQTFCKNVALHTLSISLLVDLISMVERERESSSPVIWERCLNKS